MPVHPYIPDRIEEGYGLNMDAITSLQRADDITLIITVDCGITAIDETNYALQRGIDMVITDHHECSGQAIPNAVAVVDPKRPGSQYPNGGLAGVGVAGFIAQRFGLHGSALGLGLQQALLSGGPHFL